MPAYSEGLALEVEPMGPHGGAPRGTLDRLALYAAVSGLRVAVMFAGCGGSARGHEQAGDVVLYANENWAPAVETLRVNFPRAEVDERSVREVGGPEILAACGGEVDVLDASPPCQDYSFAGKRT